MKEKILIKIVGEQKYGDETDSVELISSGTFIENEKEYFLIYDEMQDDLSTCVHVTVAIQKDKSGAKIFRKHGENLVSVMEIKNNVRCLCDYSTEYGIISMGITGTGTTADFNKNSAEFTYEYRIDSDGQLCSENRVKILCENAE